ncbi:LysM peptidoglycan-binding domain-containing protein [Cellulomonas rhizosphaerae]|uniref:LysM peptidoglycan-binding domain-containing protein n=1 Tax=Cellulomonas rhizosphaerae TaxID=2293719 RepID=A0A413RKA9_9CELL|nr:LysM peptidoglycan-binding domain-containing protein [Cellulomonas rhizosphaerae]
MAASLAVGLASGAGAAGLAVDATATGPGTEVGVTAELGWVASSTAAAEAPSESRAADAADDLGWVVSPEQPAHAPSGAQPRPTRTAGVPERSASATSQVDDPSNAAAAPADATAPADAAPDPTASPSPPRRPAGPSSGRHAVAPAGRADVASIVVRSGDSLWSIAEASLADDRGKPPSVEQVAAEWPAWYAANAEVIGTDPNVIRPGQHLVVPSSTERGAR